MFPEWVSKIITILVQAFMITAFVALDNSDGHCWVEEFYSIGASMAWLRGESYD